MAKVKPTEQTEKTTIDVRIIIDKYNATRTPDMPYMTRPLLASLLKCNTQLLVNWKAGTTPKILDSIYDMIKFAQEKGVMDELIENWEPSTEKTFVDQIIQMMQIGQCNIEDFITRAPR